MKRFLFLLLAACGGEALDPELDGEISLAEGGELRQGVLLDAPGGPAIEYRDLGDGTLLFEGDIALRAPSIGAVGDSNVGQSQQGLFSDKPLGEWPNGIVHYAYASDVPSAVRTRARAAMDLWEANTSIRFLPRTTQAAYVVIRLGDSDYAEIGRNGGRQYCTIRSAAITGVIVHELGHTLGLRHEHSRPDRNQFIKVYPDRIQTSALGAYAIFYGGTKLGPYDMGSIMHYCRHTFAKDPSIPTMTRLDGSPIPHNWIKPTAKDYAQINTLYDQTKPVVDFTAPSEDAVVSGVVAVAMKASDNAKVVRVDVSVDGALLSTDTAAPWSASWDTAALPNGFHTLTATARDAAGNVGKSSITVLVAHGCNGQP
jgi:hypothetical protein